MATILSTNLLGFVVAQTGDGSVVIQGRGAQVHRDHLLTAVKQRVYLALPVQEC